MISREGTIGLIKNVTFESRGEEGKGIGTGLCRGRTFQAKTLRWECAWCLQGTPRSSVARVE